MFSTFITCARFETSLGSLMVLLRYLRGPVGGPCLSVRRGAPIMPTVPAVRTTTLPGYAIHRESAYDALKNRTSSSSNAASSASVVKRVTFVRHAEGAFVRSLLAFGPVVVVVVVVVIALSNNRARAGASPTDEQNGNGDDSLVQGFII